MKRRTFLEVLAAVLLAGKTAVAGRLAGRAQAAVAPFDADQTATLTAIAETVLPTSLTAEDRRLAVRAFGVWFANYKAGADMGHGYGASTLRAPSGPSPIARYPPQFAALADAVRARGAASLAALPATGRREVIEAFLNQPQPVNRLPAQPTGANLVADFMGMYFNSQDGWNLCYRAEINRDSCRSLDGSEKPPRPLTAGASTH
ncbi:MAG TPA: hypothetical protein VFV78_13115 [Vicinamibacterales bacterium]|nr:hypothetical protein [Vicinamibacterales bacterium]